MNHRKINRYFDIISIVAIVLLITIALYELL